MKEVWDGAWESKSYTVIPILEFLKGTQYDDYSKAYIYGMDPNSVRVSTGSIKCDAKLNRITVYINESNIIKGIEKEIEVAFPFDMDGGELEEIRPSGNRLDD